ncbi:MAG: hypothetical protein QOH73_332 [Gaiellaceae bacterium]|jgi:hypothetical protein|nr:hypothetical protein [Gaiellaceae bacterium]
MHSRDVRAIAAFGTLVCAAPVLWSWLVWGDLEGDTAGWLFVFVVSIPPFVVATVLRDRQQLSRLGAIVATLAAGAWVVLGQVLALNPHEQSSTAALGFLIGPMYGIPSVVAVWALDRLARTLRGRLGDRLG